jgi:hypothetical protein
MPNAKKQEYYRKNKEARVQYQRAYYEKNKHIIVRKREVRDFLEPEEREAMREYNKRYYAANKERIKEQRKQKRESTIHSRSVANSNSVS